MKNTPLIPNFMRPSARRTAIAGEELLIDNFAGGGGASTGIELALHRSVDVAINHDPEAIDMHARNHPQTRHLCESVWDVDPVQVCAGRPVGVAWFSPDCKHFSRAKGAKPVSKKIRGLAWVAVKWAKLVKPRVIFLENVREFKDWGPIDAGNMPIKSKKGQTFMRFIGMMRKLGYISEWKDIDAAECGLEVDEKVIAACTHRKRLFVIFRCDGQPIIWPEPTHGSKKAREKNPRLLPFRTAAECIDWSIPCPSIFERKRPLAEKTLRRIAMGLKRYVIDNPHPFIVNVQHGGEHFRGQPLDIPLSTVTAKHGYGIVTPYVAGVGGRAGQSPATGADSPVGTITAKNDRALVTPHLVEIANSNWSEGHRPADEPMATVTANPKGGSWAVAAPLLARMRTGGQDAVSVDRPMQTICAGGRHTALVAAFLNKYRGDSAGTHPADPLPTITSGGGSARPAGAAHALGLSVAHLTKFYGTATGSSLDEPMPTVTAGAGGGHIGEVRAFLIKYFGCGVGQPVTEPLHTITTKDRFGLVQIGGQEYAIADIGLRMLTPRELLRAQFGPELAADYILPRTASAAVAKIGNSVAPLVAAAIVRANVPELIVKEKRKTA